MSGGPIHASGIAKGDLLIRVQATLPDSTVHVVREVLEECERQDSKWGEQNHDPADWLAILAEEFGEVAKETVGVTFAHPWSTNYRTELIQTAAVAVRMVESYDRRMGIEDVRAANRQMVTRPRDLTDQQIELLESEKAIPARGESKGEIHIHLDNPEQIAQDVATQIARQQRIGGR